MELEDYGVGEDSLFYNNSTLRTNDSDYFGHTVNPVPPTVIPFLPLGFGIILITVLGIIGNLVSAVVLSQRRLQSSYSVLTIGLTIVDTIYLLMKLLRYGIDSFFSYFSIAQNYTNVFLPLVNPYLRPLTFTAHTASTYFTIAIALDRYIAVRWPLQARSFCNRNRARISAVIVVLFSILYNLSRWWEFHTETIVGLNSKNQTVPVYSMQISELRVDPNYKLYYIFWAYLIVMFVLPIISLTFFNFHIWIGIRRSVQKGVTLTSIQKRDNSFAAMLVGVVIVFLVCNLDYLILDLMDFFGHPYSEFWNYMGNFLLTVNSAVNFTIYCVCGWKFREELSKMWSEFECCRVGKIGSHEINYSGDDDEDEKDSYYTQNFNMETHPSIKSAPM